MQARKTKYVTYKLGYHFVWCPKYRKAVLTGEVQAFLDNEIRRLCAENGWEVGSLNVQPDHVHLFVSAPPAIAPSLIANTLKGITARQVFKRFPELKAKEFWGGHLWSRSFYVGSVGDMSEDVVRRYIELGQGQT